MWFRSKNVVTDKKAEAAAWFLKHFEINGYVNFEKLDRKITIHIHGSCRLRSQIEVVNPEFQFGTITGNFNFRHATKISAENMPQNVEGIAMFSWTESAPLLSLVCKSYDFILFDENANIIKHNVSDIVKKYRHPKCTKRRILDAQAELIAAGFVDNARW